MSQDHIDSEAKPLVAVFRLQLFKASETFILAQARTYSKYRPVFVGLDTHGPAGEGVRFVTPAGGAIAKLRILLGDVRPLLAVMPERPQVIHAHFAVDAILALPLARHFGVPLVTTLHGFDVTTKARRWLASRRPALVNAALRMGSLMRKGDLFLAVSGYIRDVAIARGFPASRTDIGYLGINLGNFDASETPNSKLIVHVGRLVEKKGTESLIRAFAEVRPRCPEARLLICGNGPLLPHLTAMAKALAIDDAVEFAGMVDHPTTIAHLAAAQVVAVPSVIAADGDREGLPTVILEAAALGRPVVGTFHSGIPEAIGDGETGLLVGERDPSALADALVALLLDHDKAVAYGQAARRLMEDRHDARRLTMQLEDRYDQLIEGKSK